MSDTAPCIWQQDSGLQVNCETEVESIFMFSRRVFGFAAIQLQKYRTNKISVKLTEKLR